MNNVWSRQHTAKAFNRFKRVAALNESRSQLVRRKGLGTDMRPCKVDDLQHSEHGDLESVHSRPERSGTSQSSGNVVQKQREDDAIVPSENPPYVPHSILSNDPRVRYVPEMAQPSSKTQGEAPVNVSENASVSKAEGFKIDQPAVRATKDTRYLLNESEQRGLDYLSFRLLLQSIPEHDHVIALLSKKVDFNPFLRHIESGSRTLRICVSPCVQIGCEC